MVNIIKWLTAVVALVKAIIELVKAFEVPGFGQEKKQAVLEVVGIIWDGFANVFDLPWDKAKVQQFADQVIEIIVKFFNVIGFFKHGEASPQ